VTAIVWFRRDLRLHDNPALQAACERHDQLVPVFCLDPRLMQGRNRSLPRARFLLGCLAELSAGLETLGSRLVVISGSSQQALPAFARSCRADVVFAATDVSPFARRRDAETRRTLADSGRTLELLPGNFVVDDLAAVRTGDDDPYTVFTPFYRRWLTAARRPVLPAPSSVPPLPNGLAAAPLPSLDALGIENAPDLDDAHRADLGWEPGEQAGRAAADRFVDERATAYADSHDALDRSGTSRLSPYLHFGCVSPRELEHSLGEDAGGQALRRQLCWRDFYAHVLLFNPQQLFEAWRDGRTGYPLVDAAMRQLAATGWIHNRARMVVGSFLVKDLGIDWRWGERWFMRLLLDGDVANNNGNWQWIASVGVDPQPVSRRIFNPTLQQRRFDPDGMYVRSYVPELENVPLEHLAEPWTMPIKV
jgi:deoxyribodipyrimidine photo-lyase